MNQTRDLISTGPESGTLQDLHPATVELIEVYCAGLGLELPPLTLSEFGGNVALCASVAEGRHLSVSVE